MFRRMFWALIGLVTPLALGAVCAAAGSGAQGQAAGPAAPPSSAPAKIQTTTQEVLVDIIARDRHGRAIRNLQPVEVEIYEDGVLQHPTSFRLVEGNAPAPEAAQPAGVAPAPRQFLRNISLVSLVFERLDGTAAQLAREAAMDFLHTQLRENVFVSVFVLGEKLYVLQEFTNDRKALEEAVGRATKNSSVQLAAYSDSIRSRLEQAMGDYAAATQAAGQTTTGSAVSASAAGAAAAEAAFTRMTAEMLSMAETMAEDQEGRSSLYGLLGMIEGQRKLTGRKTIIYFTRGMHLNTSLWELFRTTISEANRNNVSFYVVDARGLSSSEVMSYAAHQVMLGAESSEHNMLLDSNIGGSEVVAGEALGSGARPDVQGVMMDLATSTGGFLIANTNDLRVGVRRIAEDISDYYEVAYSPPPHPYDGRFHAITVKVLRRGASVQARSGYFAFPPMGGAPVFTYEVPLLKALQNQTAAGRPNYHVATLHFGYSPAGLQYRLMMTVPLSHFTFTDDAKNKVYRAHFVLLALVKNEQGQVVQKFSRDFSMDGPEDRLLAVKNSEVLFRRDFRVPPGRYALETVAYDVDTQKSTIERYVLVAPQKTANVSLSSVSVIERLEPLKPDQSAPDGLFQYNSMEVVPNIDQPIRKTSGAGVPIYFVVYVPAHSGQAPRADLQLVRDGEVIASTPLQLPAADASGRITYVGTIPVDKFPPGRYEIRAQVREGTAAAEEYAFFTLAP